MFETIEPGPEWPEDLQVLTLVHDAREPFLLLGGRTNLGGLVDEARVVRLSLSGESEWASVAASLSPDGRVVTAIEPIGNAGAAWISGWGYDESVANDHPGWLWIGRIEADGSWAWLADTEHSDYAFAIAVRADESAVILEQGVMTGNTSLYAFSSLGELDWWAPHWDLVGGGKWARGIIDREGELLTAGGESIYDADWNLLAGNLWISRLTGSGELLGESIHASPNFGFVAATGCVHDPITDTLAVPIIEDYQPSGEDRFGWVRLDGSGETVLAWRTIDVGLPVELEPDGAGGVHLLSAHGEDGLRLGHYPADPEAPAIWSVGSPHEPVDLAVDHAGGRAYVLTSTGIDVFML